MSVTRPAPGLPLGNFLALGAGEIGARVVGFFIVALLARRLGVDAFGVLGFATALTSYFIAVPSGGVQDLATRAVAARPSEVEQLAASIVKVRLLIALGGLALIGLLALVLPKPVEVRVVVALCGLSLLPMAINLSWAYKALEKTRSVGVSLVASQVAIGAGVIWFVLDPEHLRRVPVIQAVGELLAALLLVPMAWRGWVCGSIHEGLVALRGMGTITLGRLLRTAIVTADVVLLSFMMSDRDVGLYSAAYRVCFLLTAIAVSAHVVFLPALSRAANDPEKAGAALSQSLWLAWMVAIPCVAGGVLLAPDILEFLFGGEYVGGGSAFRLLLLSIGLLFLHGTVHNAYLATNRLGLETSVYGLAAGVNVVLNLVLIPRLGLVGAALATVAAEAVILSAAVVVVRRWEWRLQLRPMVTPTIAATAMVIVLLLAVGLWLPARLLLGGGTYILVLALTGGMSVPGVRHPNV